MDEPSREQGDLEGAGALLFFSVLREREAKLEVSPTADSGAGGDGRREGSRTLPPLSWRPSDPARAVIAGHPSSSQTEESVLVWYRL